MTVTAHQHGCAEVDHLEDEIRDLRQSLTVYANEHMRMAAVFIAARALAAVFKLDGRDPNVDVDLAMEQACRRLAEAVEMAEEPHLHPDALSQRIRQAIGDPGSIVPHGLDSGGGPAETVTAWAHRAVLHVLTHGAKAGV